MLYIKNINYPIKKSKIIIYKTPAGLLISSFNLFFYLFFCFYLPLKVIHALLLSYLISNATSGFSFKYCLAFSLP